MEEWRYPQKQHFEKACRPIDSNTDFGYEWADVEKAYKGATPEARAAAKAAALAVLESGKK